MRKIRLLISLGVLLFILIACSIKSQERTQNEEKLKKLAENLGANPKEVEQNLKKMSDKELAEATTFLNDDGTLDINRLMKDGIQESSEKQEQQANALPLREITLNCEIFQDPASREYTKTIINLNACADNGEDYSCLSKSNLKGNINIKLYGYKLTNPGGRYEIFEKGKLLAEFNGPITKTMSIEKTEAGLLETNIVYQTEISSEKILNSAVEYSFQDRQEDEYKRKYVRIPFIINAIFVDDDGKEYLYNDNVYFEPSSVFHECAIVTEVIS